MLGGPCAFPVLAAVGLSPHDRVFRIHVTDITQGLCVGSELKCRAGLAEGAGLFAFNFLTVQYVMAKSSFPRSLLESTPSPVVFCHNDCQEGKVESVRRACVCLKDCLPGVQEERIRGVKLQHGQTMKCCVTIQ